MRNVPYCLGHLNTWSPVSAAVGGGGGGLGGVALMKDGYHCKQALKA